MPGHLSITFLEFGTLRGLGWGFARCTTVPLKNGSGIPFGIFGLDRLLFAGSR